MSRTVFKCAVLTFFILYITGLILGLYESRALAKEYPYYGEVLFLCPGFLAASHPCNLLEILIQNPLLVILRGIINLSFTVYIALISPTLIFILLKQHKT